jgi:hypothetical protein
MKLRVVGMLGAALLACFAGGRLAWARTARHPTTGLWIVADRIVGFVPFTVSIYGRVLGPLPDQIELCRSETAWLTDSGSSRLRGGPAVAVDAPPGSDDPQGLCALGRVERTPEGYDYAHEMRFDRPGVYQVRLMMVDAEGRRLVSNTVQVNAL